MRFEQGIVLFLILTAVLAIVKYLLSDSSKLK